MTSGVPGLGSCCTRRSSRIKDRSEALLSVVCVGGEDGADDVEGRRALLYHFWRGPVDCIRGSSIVHGLSAHRMELRADYRDVRIFFPWCVGPFAAPARGRSNGRRGAVARGHRLADSAPRAQTMLRRLACALGMPRGACGAVRYLSSGPARTSVATLPRCTVLELEGRDTFKFLQGAITNNVQRLEEERRAGDVARDVFYAAFLNPQGRMVADALLYHMVQAKDPSVLIEVDSQIQGELVKFLKRFKLRSKFRITDVSDAWDVRQVWGPGAEALIGNTPTDDPRTVAVRDVRAPSMGWRVLSPAGETRTWPTLTQPRSWHRPTR